MPRLILISTVGAPDEHRRNADALRRARNADYQYYLSRLYQQRGLLHESLGEWGPALEDFEQGITEREKESLSIGDRLDRVSLLDRNGDLFASAIEMPGTSCCSSGRAFFRPAGVFG